MHSYKNLAVLALTASAISPALAAPAQAGRNHARGFHEFSHSAPLEHPPPPYEHAAPATTTPGAGKGMGKLASGLLGAGAVVGLQQLAPNPPQVLVPAQAQAQAPPQASAPAQAQPTRRSTLGRRSPEEFESRADESDGVDFNNLYETPLSHDHRRDQQSDLLGTVAVLNALSKSNPGKRADDIDPASVALLHALISRWSKRGDDVDPERQALATLLGLHNRELDMLD